MLALGIPPSRIVILGQSLGTAVATAVGLHYADPTSELLPEIALPGVKTERMVFGGIILVAPFTSLPDLLMSYRIGGLIPILAPLRNTPFLVKAITTYILDIWPTGLRLSSYVSAASKLSNPNTSGNVHIVHARNDADISYIQGEKLFAMATGREEERLPLGRLVEGRKDGVEVRIEMLEFGGHNRVVTYAPVGLAVMEAFEGL